jgi:hypothetical protein
MAQHQNVPRPEPDQWSSSPWGAADSGAAQVQGDESYPQPGPYAAERYDPLEEFRHQLSEAPPPPRVPLVRQLMRSWPFWSVGALALVTGVGIVSAISLFRIPNLPNCRAIFWLTASATTRLQCAEAYAGQRTLDGYLDAIALVDALPDDHPLRAEVDLQIETWAEEILKLAEATFQAGRLPDAIAMVRRIPADTTAAAAVSEQVGEWNQIWEEAEVIYAAAEKDLNALEFQEAFNKAIQLLQVNNDYWETVKFDELTTRITAAREDLNELGRAKQLAQQGTLNAMAEAIAIAKGIDRQSPVYNEAQTVLRELGRDLLDLAEAALDRRDADTANQFLDTIPSDLGLQSEIADMRTIVDASTLSWRGGITGLQGAITRLQSISNDRPLYGKAQRLMQRWQAEVQGRSQLEWARQLAAPGTVADLQTAIAEAQQIDRNNPAWDDAEAEIDRWRDQIQTTQDRPIIMQADQLANAGDLSGAIAVARRVTPGRALYSEAKDKIDRWQDQIQRAEDGPILAQAQRLASAGQLQEAITVASRIGNNRALYSDAQADIRRWRDQVQGQQNLQRAYLVAQRGSVSSLVEAIELAQAIPNSSPQKTEANQALTRWSWDILRMAETEAQYNLDRAIDIAESVPTQTEAYAQAQLRLREWRSSVNQTPIGTPPPTSNDLGF